MSERRFNVVDCNIGPGLNLDQIDMLRNSAGLISWQEASDQGNLFDHFGFHQKWETIRPGGPGSATPVSVNLRLWDVRDTFNVKLLDNRSPFGKDGGKEKRLVGAHVVHLETRRHLLFGSMHSIVTHGRNERKALQQNRKVARFFDRKMVGMFGCDMNDEAESRCTLPLRSSGMNCDQIAGVQYLDRMDRIIQVWWTRDSRIMFRGHRLLKIHPHDHNANLCTFEWAAR